MQIKKMALCAMFSALLCISAWLAIPIGQISITLQTLVIFLCLGLLGGKYGSISIFVYLLLGAVGLPVFSGFQGGMGPLLGTTGGYIWGFLVMGLVYWLITGIWKNNRFSPVLAMLTGLLLCYTLGTLWYGYLYAQGNTLWLILLQCVVPYVLPDMVKLFFAVYLTKRILHR